MSIVVGELLIKMAADVAQLRTDMAEGKGVVKGAMADITAAVGIAKTALGALGVAVSAGAFVEMIKGTIEAKARLFDLHLVAGETVENLSALVQVGKLSGTAAEDIATGMNKLSKNLAGVDEDSKGAAQAIAALGLNFTQFKGLSPAEQMQAVAKALEGFADGAGKSQAAMLLYGKAGAQFLPFLKQLAETTNLVGVETTESARRAKEFEENIARLKIAGEEWKRTLVNDMLPPLIEFTNQLIDGRNAFGGWLSAIANLGTLNPFNSVGENIDKVRANIKALQYDIAHLADPAAIAAVTEHLATAQKTLAYLLAQQSRAALALGAGVADDPRIAARKGVLDIKPPPQAAQASEYDRLIARIREKIAAEQEELQVDQKLTEGQKLAAAVMVMLRDRTLDATVAGRKMLASELERLIADEKLNAARKKELEAEQARNRELEAGYARIQSLREQVKAQREATEELGLYGAALDDLRIKRMLDAAALLYEKAATLQLFDAQSPLIQVIKDEAAAVDARANAYVLDAQKRKALGADPYAGARRGLDEYLSDIRDVNNAAYQLIKGTAGRLEDSLTDFFTTGHFGARKFVDQLIAEFARLAVVRPLLNSLLGSSFGSGLVSTFGSLFGAGSLTGALDGGSVSGPGISVPANFTLGASGGSAIQSAGRAMTVQIVNTVNGSNLSPSQMASALAANTDRTIAKLADMQRRGVALA